MNENRKFRMNIAYNGTRFSGWQVQPDKITVQGEIEKNLSVLLNENVKIYGASRTDAGVHAKGQTAHFETGSSKTPEELLRSLNKRLGDDIYIKNITETCSSFNARKSAKGKHYQYRVWIAEEKPVFDKDFVYVYYGKSLDIDKMINASKHFIGTHDYTSFGSNSKRPDENKIRTVTEIDISKTDTMIIFDIKGESFLYKMVRGITGTLLEIGRGKNFDVQEIFQNRNRCSAGRNLPAKGLFLVEVYY